MRILCRNHIHHLHHIQCISLRFGEERMTATYIPIEEGAVKEFISSKKIFKEKKTYNL